MNVSLLQRDEGGATAMNRLVEYEHIQLAELLALLITLPPSVRLDLINTIVAEQKIKKPIMPGQELPRWVFISKN